MASKFFRASGDGRRAVSVPPYTLRTGMSVTGSFESVTFVVSGNTQPAQLFFFVDCKRQGCSNGGCDFRAEGDCTSLPARVYSVGQDNDEGVTSGIDPD